jgi:hypothetical protein
MSGSASLHANVTPCPSCQAPFSLDLNQDQADLVDDSTLSVSRQTSSAVSNGTSSAGMPSLKELPHVATGSILRRINLMEFATSTKIEALTEELVMMRRSSPGSKAIVFSQFVNMLDLIRWRLHSDPCLGNMGLGARALHGGMDVKARDAVLKDFREDPSVRVLLMSLKAGGVALNLTIANHIYLMDPWWNPAAEMQAIDRTHRLGTYYHSCMSIGWCYTLHLWLTLLPTFCTICSSFLQVNIARSELFVSLRKTLWKSGFYSFKRKSVSFLMVLLEGALGIIRYTFCCFFLIIRVSHLTMMFYFRSFITLAHI